MLTTMHKINLTLCFIIQRLVDNIESGIVRKKLMTRNSRNTSISYYFPYLVLWNRRLQIQKL